MLMYNLYFLILILILLLLFLIFYNNNKLEGYFTFYKGMPGIPKTYISTGYIRNPGFDCYQNSYVS
jgi:uncharacterized integral membrane protein